MAIKTSTGLRSKMLDTGSIKSILGLGFINIYAGPVPADADAALGAATLLCVISNNASGNGLSLATAAVGGTLAKDSAQVWSGMSSVGGVASFYRHVAPSDTGDASVAAPRIQGIIANIGGDMNLSNTTLASGAVQTIDYYLLSFPVL